MQPSTSTNSEIDEECGSFSCLIIFFQVISVLITIFIFCGSKERIWEHPEANFYVHMCSIALLIILWICIILERSLKFWDYKRKTPKLEKCRRNLLIGLGGIALCGIIPQVTVLVVGDNVFIMTSCAIICNLSPILIMLLFFRGNVSNYELNVNTEQWSPLKPTILSFQTILVIILSILAYIFWNRKDADSVLMCFLYYTVLFSPSTAEFFAILKHGIRFKTRRSMIPERRGPKEHDGMLMEETRRLRSQPHHTVVKMNPNNYVMRDTDLAFSTVNPRTAGMECKICRRNYGTLVIPRFLVACGHTVCERCVRNLMKEEKDAVLCPFCRRLTLVPDGKVKNLPKNFAILEMIEEMKQ